MTLNDRIEITVRLTQPAADPAYYNYTVVNRIATPQTRLYTGRVFFDAGEQEKRVCLNDIMEGLKLDKWYEYITLTQGNAGDVNYDYHTYGIYMALKGDGIEDQNFYVALVHPQRFIEYQEESIDNSNLAYTPMLSGYHFTSPDSNIGTPGLLPVIPYDYSGESPLVSMYQCMISSIKNGEHDLAYGKFVDGEFELYDTFKVDTSSRCVAYNSQIPISDFEPGEEIVIAYNSKNPDSTDYDTYVKVAKIDECDTRFYLSWFDRMGGVQMQPFNKGYKRTSQYDTVNKVNQYGEEEKIAITVNDVFELNTGWVNENLLPYYEGLFISPFVSLYEKDEWGIGTHYKCVVENKEFEYKTFKNQGRQLFNLKVTVRISQKENILY